MSLGEHGIDGVADRVGKPARRDLFTAELGAESLPTAAVDGDVEAGRLRAVSSRRRGGSGQRSGGIRRLSAMGEACEVIGEDAAMSFVDLLEGSAV